jgi:Uncharacterized protein conserved in bacteria
MHHSNNIALKEWAVTVKALGEGKQVILLRKGGIREESREFRIEHDRFLFYPTYEHQREDLLKEEFRDDLRVVLEEWSRSRSTINIRYRAVITDVFLINEPERVEVLSPYYIWTTDYIHERLKWRPKKPLYVLFLRVSNLTQPKPITVLPEHGGCKSWLVLDGEFGSERGMSVLSDKEFTSTVEEIKTLLKV